MKQILILTTGGTIASKTTAYGLRPEAANSLVTQTVQDVIKSLPFEINVTVEELCSLDSSNMQPGDWLAIANCASQRLVAYDGLVITHGTDTMAYTAAALFFLLKEIKKPVILTGSQLPLSKEGSDGYRNLADAIYVAASDLAGVHMVFAGRILHGLCGKKMQGKALDAFRSIHFPQVGQVDSRGGKMVLCPDFDESAIVEEVERVFPQDREKDRDSVNRYETVIEEDTQEEPPRIAHRKLCGGCTHMNKKVALIKLYPGMMPAMLRRMLVLPQQSADATQDETASHMSSHIGADGVSAWTNRSLLGDEENWLDGVIIEGFGCGGIPSREDSDYNLLPVLQEAIDHDTKVIITSQCTYDGADIETYQVGKLAKELGAISGGKLTCEALYAGMLFGCLA